MWLVQLVESISFGWVNREKTNEDDADNDVDNNKNDDDDVEW